jgi:glutaredoxin/glutathione-dependent peroxiredoxin
MPIAVGDLLPPTTFRVLTSEGVEARETAEIFADKTVVLFAVPGAFTPTCHRNHLPGYIRLADQIKAAGVDTIAVTSTNDPFVMGAWAKESGAGDAILFLADGNGDFAKAIGLSQDGSARGMGLRSQRYAMLVRNGRVEHLSVEEKPGVAELSGAEAMLSTLTGGTGS